MRRLLEQVEHGGELRHVVRAVGQPPAAQQPSSTYHPQPAGPGLPRAEPSAAAMIVTCPILRSGFGQQVGE